MRLVQPARPSSVPAGRNSRSIGRGVRGFKLVMVSAVSASSWRFRGRGARARTCELTAAGAVELHDSSAVREHVKRSCGRSIGAGVGNSVHAAWQSPLQVRKAILRGRSSMHAPGRQQPFFLTYPRHLPGALSRWPSRGPAHLQRATRKGAPSSGKLSRVFSSPSQAAAWQAAEEKCHLIGL